MSASAVGLNLLWLVPGEVGGSEQSTVATVRGLLDLAPDDLDLRLFVLPGFAAAYPDLVDAVATEVAPIDGRSRARRVVTESTWLRTRTRGLDLVHHAGGTVPARRSAPAVLTLHDLQPLRDARRGHPGVAGGQKGATALSGRLAHRLGSVEARATHSWLKRTYLGRAIPAAVRSARRVAVPSEFVRGTVVGRLGAPSEKVVSIPHAVPVRPPPTDPATLVERYDLHGPVILYAAITYPHKDHVTLVRAFEQVHLHHPDAVLVLAGGQGDAEADVRAALARPTIAGSVRRLGRIAEADVAGLLDLATVVAVPSRYEGFGLPALEAMAAGVPVVASDATALPEVLGGCGILVATGDVGAWSHAIDGLLDDHLARMRLGDAGRSRAAGYSSEANAEAFAGLYRDALEMG